MKQTIKRLAITFGKKVWAALISAVAMLIGETILSLFGKGLSKFKANREKRKSELTDATATKLNEAENPKTEVTETVIPEENTETSVETDNTDNDKN